jgi:hypothetical protein
MSKVLNMPLKNCENHYSAEELYENFGMSEKEIQNCLKCSNRCTEGGIITCKYLLKGFESEEDT